MIEGLTLILSGEEFNLDYFLSHINTRVDFDIVKTQRKGETFGENLRAIENICHIRRKSCAIASVYKILNTEEWYIEFIEKIYPLLQDCHVDEITLWIDLYMTKGLHAYQFFNTNLLAKIGKFKVSLPVDFHIMSQREIIKFAKENKVDFDDKEELF